MSDKRCRFEMEVLPHLDAVYRFARWLTRSSADADDIVQESILRAFRGFDALRGADVKAWLFTIVKNCHATAIKRQKRTNFSPLPDEHEAVDNPTVAATVPDPESASIQRDERRMLDRLMATLPEEQREVLVLREVEDMDYRQIAAITNVPIGTVMSRLARARAGLKARWMKEIGGREHGVH